MKINTEIDVKCVSLVQNSMAVITVFGTIQNREFVIAKFCTDQSNQYWKYNALTLEGIQQAALNTLERKVLYMPIFDQFPTVGTRRRLVDAKDYVAQAIGFEAFSFIVEALTGINPGDRNCYPQFDSQDSRCPVAEKESGWNNFKSFITGSSSLLEQGK